MIKQEPEEPATEKAPELPALPDPDEPPMKIKKENSTSEIDGGKRSALAGLFGDVFITKVEPGKSLNERVVLELDAYQSSPVPAIDTNPLQWWKEHAINFPILSKYAKKMLSVPATSVASERVFSSAGDVVSAKRACLSPEQVNMLVFLKKTIKIPEDLS